MTYQFCQCHDGAFRGSYFIEKVAGTYQRTDRADVNYILNSFNSTKHLLEVLDWDENGPVPPCEYDVLCQFNHLDELLSTYPEVFL